MNATRDRTRGSLFGVAAAALFGASAPVAKLVLPETGPVLLAALLYLGAGTALSIVRLVRGHHGEARVQRGDVVLLAGIVVTGGILGPVLMLVGLGRLSAVAGALLLNLEAPFTILIAVIVFREHLGRRLALAAALIIGAAAILGWSPGDLHGDGLGVLCIAGACASWGVDNNLTQRLSLRDPIAVVHIKTLGAGACTLAIALATGHRLPAPTVTVAALVLGAASYGLSIVLDTYALRWLGAAREAAIFATAPFVGAALAIPLHGAWPSPADAVAAVIMIGGVALLVRERHGHAHTHDPLEHDHLHVHDEHHAHAHDGPVAEPHAHPHRHAPLTHDHPHTPDLHHRHRH
jgi:drug/metabolite transporter (DMT)-like permease